MTGASPVQGRETKRGWSETNRPFGETNMPIFDTDAAVSDTHAIDDYPWCARCGSSMSYERCHDCEDGYSHHDCGEDCCFCLHPEPNVICDTCGGDEGWWVCLSVKCRTAQSLARLAQGAD